MIHPYTLTQQAAGIAAVSDIANRYGVTAFGDALVPEMAMHAYKLAYEAVELNIHAVLYQQSYGHGGEPEPLESVATYDERAIEYGSENLKTRAIKFFLDGVPTASRSALMVAPYTCLLYTSPSPRD